MTNFLYIHDQIDLTPNDLKPEKIQENSLNEFNALVEKLQSVGVNVIVIEDDKATDTPDSIFPNNWVSFHESGNVAIYPMCAENRRDERREDILDILVDDYNFSINDIKDFTEFENHNKFLEGTGSMVLDRENKIAYAALSQRTDKSLVEKFCQHLDYQAITFEAFQKVKNKNEAIYHTNVLMSVTQNLAIICDETISNLVEREKVITTLAHSGKEIVHISIAQKNNFAGNMLALENSKGEKIMVMSEQAFHSLNKSQIQQISSKYSILYADIQYIETCGGGSVRCMLAEIFLPKKKS